MASETVPECDASVPETEVIKLTEADFQRKLFEIPEELEFPLEISHHIKGKLHSVLEQNWHLKRHLDYLDKEVVELRKYRAEHREKCGRLMESDYSNSSTTIMTQRIVELSKKNRDLTAQTEGMKTKITKVIRENESLRNMVECFRDKDSQDDISSQNANADLGSSTTPGSQQIAQLTNKVIEYRRQNQLLKMELRTALRALSQEVGDGATPHSVLNVVSGSGGAGWRGRQQQILAFQQKVSELHQKLKEVSGIGDQEHCIFQQTHGAGDADMFLGMDKQDKLGNAHNNIPQRAALLQQERKKKEQIDKLTHELDTTTKEWKACQHELKASKARIQTLESHVKTFKSQLEILEKKLNESEKTSEVSEKEMKMLRQDIANLKDKERRYRDQTILEVQEGQRALQRERAVVLRLQSVIQEKQEAIQRLDADLIELRSKLEISCSGNMGGGIGTVDKVRDLETQLQNANKCMEAGDREKQGLLKIMQNYLNQVEEERQRSVQSSEYTARLSCVLKRADQCINECLDAAQVTNEDILQEVEHIRTLIRELKLGDLYVYENMPQKDVTKKLKTQIEMLKREVSTLKASLKEVSNSRKKDLLSFASVTDQLKSDLANMCNAKQTAPGTV